jgi:hypothetical protein
MVYDFTKTVFENIELWSVYTGLGRRRKGLILFSDYLKIILGILDRME